MSSSVAAHLRRLRVDEARIDVVPNGVDHDGSTRPPPGGRPAGAGRPPAIVFVGRLIANKGPGLFVEALGALAAAGLEFTADVVGDGPLRARLEAQVARLGLTEWSRSAARWPTSPTGCGRPTSWCARR